MAEVNEYNSASVDPSKSPNNDFELYSVPAYETGIPEFVKGKDISYIINCSAYTAVDKAESDADFAKKLNEDGPRNIANLANQIHAKMIHISTDYVFDGTGTEPYTEDMSVAPIGVYGRTKAAGEAAVKQNLKEYYIIRTVWLC